jgi:2-dehydro-3-deoxygluconokinase
MKPILSFGELLLRMSPPANGKWITDAAMPVYLGGAELNVANALACWRLPVRYCTALPNNTLSGDICNTLTAKGIDVSPVHFSGSRIGIYYLTQGTDLKSAGVIYDRAFSSFSQLQPGMINWDAVLEGVSWLHFSAISPALNENIVDVCKEALKAAENKNVTVSVDLNYRAKLWKWGRPPIEVMPELVQYCDVIMGNIWSANTLLGIPVDSNIHARGNKETYLQHATETAQQLMQFYPKCKWVAQTFRFDENSGIKYYATLNSAQQQYVSKEFYMEVIKDKVGSGDCFMAGLIYGITQQHLPQNIVDFAAAAAVSKMNEVGDATQQTVSAVEERIAANE